MLKKELKFTLLGLLLTVLSVPTFAGSTQPIHIEVAFINTVHISFPAKIKYVDLGSNLILAGKADEAENILRVKAAYRGFSEQTNFSVLCEDGSFWLFQADYREQPKQQFYEMKAINTQDIRLSELKGQSPVVVDLVLKSLYKNNNRNIKNRGMRKERIEGVLKGIYVHNDILYFHFSFKNKSNVSYDIDYMKFIETDKKHLRKQSSQELPIYPVREYNGNNSKRIIVGKQYHTVVAFNKFTIPADKKMVFYLAEKNGGRHLTFDILPEDIINATPITDVNI